MRLQFTEEQVMLQKLVRDFAKKEVEPVVETMEGTKEFPFELVSKMGELGLMGIPIPEEYGGSGLDFTSYIMTIHELSKVSATIGLILSVHTSVGTKPILDFGTEAQKKKYIPKLASGKYIGAFALTEAQAGSDAASLKLKATKQADGYLLNGSKMFITNGKEATTFITFARTSEESGNKGISAFIVEKDVPGMTIGKSEAKMGMHGSSTVSLSFEDCFIPAENLLGKEGEGFNVAMANLNIGRTGIAAQALGIAEGALDHAIAYAQEGIQFGKPIADQEALATEVEAAKMLVYHATSCIEAGQDSIQAVSMAKKYASATAMKVAVEAVQVHGSYGYTKDYPVERFFRDAKVTSIYEGTTEIQNIVIAKQALK